MDIDEEDATRLDESDREGDHDVDYNDDDDDDAAEASSSLQDNPRLQDSSISLSSLSSLRKWKSHQQFVFTTLGRFV